MAGMNFLSEYMKDFPDEYILIGGNACALQFEYLEASFRKTDDLDIVLLIEDKSQDFLNILMIFLIIIATLEKHLMDLTLVVLPTDLYCLQIKIMMNYQFKLNYSQENLTILTQIPQLACI